MLVTQGDTQVVFLQNSLSQLLEKKTLTSGELKDTAA
jgi:hypothetical protein